MLVSTISLLIPFRLGNPSNFFQMSFLFIPIHFLPNLWWDSSSCSIAIVLSIVVVILMCHIGVAVLVAFVVLVLVVVSSLGVCVIGIPRGTRAFALVQHVVLIKQPLHTLITIVIRHHQCIHYVTVAPISNLREQKGLSHDIRNQIIGILEVLNCIPELGQEHWNTSWTVILHLDAVKPSHSHGSHLPYIVFSLIDIQQLKVGTSAISC